MLHITVMPVSQLPKTIIDQVHSNLQKRNQHSCCSLLSRNVRMHLLPSSCQFQVSAVPLTSIQTDKAPLPIAHPNPSNQFLAILSLMKSNTIIFFSLLQSSTIKFNYQSEISKYPNKIVYLLGQQTAFKLPQSLSILEQPKVKLEHVHLNLMCI